MLQSYRAPMDLCTRDIYAELSNGDGKYTEEFEEFRNSVVKELKCVSKRLLDELDTSLCLWTFVIHNYMAVLVSYWIVRQAHHRYTTSALCYCYWLTYRMLLVFWCIFVRSASNAKQKESLILEFLQYRPYSSGLTLMKPKYFISTRNLAVSSILEGLLDISG